MTDQPLDPRDDRLDDVDAPRDAVLDPDQPVVDLDRVDDEVDGEHETADDKYIQVVDGRPETLGVEPRDGAVPDAPRDDELGFKGDMYTTEPGTEGSSRA